MTVNTGSPVGNPGYSFASKWSLKQYLTTGNGYYTVVVWVGKNGGDNILARKEFETWLRDFTVVDPTKITYAKPL